MENSFGIDWIPERSCPNLMQEGHVIMIIIKKNELLVTILILLLSNSRKTGNNLNIRVKGY